MCEADAFFVTSSKELLILESVYIVRPFGKDSWLLVNVFGDQKTVSGRIVGMNLVDHKILFASSKHEVNSR